VKTRHPHARPAVEDRAPLLDRLLWSRDQHPILERLLIGFAIAAIVAEAAYQLLLAVARNAHAVAPY